MSDARQVAKWLRQASRCVVFTGAGISTESGIPDFRSPGGVWSRFKPVYFDQFLASAEARDEYWRQKVAAHKEFAQASPNSAHLALAEWEQAGIVRAVITQNIDGLHQLAGSDNVLELHGTARVICCLDCGVRFDVDPLVESFRQTGRAPSCEHCGGMLKHATVSFGQSLPGEVLNEATRLARKSDLFLAMGSSLCVEPAASLPRIAKQSGAKLVIINRDPTEQDELADTVLRGSLGETLQDLERLLNVPSNAG